MAITAAADKRMATAVRSERAVKVFGSSATEVRALDDVTVGFERGRFSAIMGPSGSGKSTLLHCLAGLEPLTSGRVLLGETDISTLSDHDLTVFRRDHIGFVFQAFNLIPSLSAEQNITVQLRLGRHDVPADWFDEVVRTLQLGDRLTHRPSELSGGQQQRVAVARALIGRPEIVFADEPTGNLDSAAGLEVLRYLRRAVDELGQTVVMVTHDAAAAGHADRVVFLADGRVADEMITPTTERLLDHLKRSEA